MKTAILRQKSKEELHALLSEYRERIDALAPLMHGKKVKNVKERAAIKKDIARILTIMRI